MRVLWLTNIPSPYRLKFFSELGKHVQLTVLFEKGFSAERDETWKDYQFVNYTGIVLRGISVLTDMAISVGFKRYIDNFRKDIIVVSNPITPTGIAAILYMQRHGIQYCIESDGAFPKEKVGLRGALKHRLYSRAHLCLTTSELGKQYFLNYGVEKEKIIKYPFSSVLQSEILQKKINKEEKKKLLKSLGIENSHMILSVGRFIPIKGFDNLITAFNQIETDCDLCIVGGKPSEDYQALVNPRGKNAVHFIDFMVSSELNQYYDAADVFAFTSHGDVWGLVVNEAMARGLPVVTTDHAIAGVEMVVDGENGFVVADNDIDALRSAIEQVLSSERYEAMSSSAIEMAQKYTIDIMASCHVQIFRSFFEISYEENN